MDSALHVAIRGGSEYIGWDRHAYMLADLFDAVQFLTHAFVTANSKRKPKAPDPYPRPGERSRVTKKKEVNPLLMALKGLDPQTAVKAGPKVVPLPPQR